MKWLDRFLRVEDNLPIGSVDAIFCSSYCLIKDGSDLTVMNKSCVNKVADLLLKNYSSMAIFSNAYEEFAAIEISLRKEILAHRLISGRNFWWIAPVVSTYDEVSQLKRGIESFKIRKLLVVAEAYHMKRVLSAIRQFIPEIDLYWISVDCPKFEATQEPFKIKSFRASRKSLWMVWNILCNLVNPILLRGK